ncbi:hypothetical protein OHB26_39300 (plasmid) [Nocardia sp. NBC_01503]|uniref:hypothetical protein n=1 Tax=Nocardia sp. NBC_01503 TaxID=2975997 RepID=UPI002E7B23B4|nr:hypothetical protein [Nocardia sp. NBC_01503]WTL36726.1 hypothetical protein OHB26_39300 [Nocardia sp. NBC_01503]
MLEIRAEAPKIDLQTLKNTSSAYTALTRLRDAADLWAELNRPQPSATDPAACPPWSTPTDPTRSDSGITRNDVGIRLRLSMPDGWSPHDLEDEKKSQNLASALDVPAVQLIEADGNRPAGAACSTRSPVATSSWSQRYRSRAARPAPNTGYRYHRLDATTISAWAEYGDSTMNSRAMHRAIQGATRSGKSVTFNTMIAYSLLMKDTITVIIDPNGATVAPFWECADYVRLRDPSTPSRYSTSC